MRALADCPGCNGGTLEPLPAVAPTALSCGACCGFWLDTTASGLVTARPSQSPRPSKPPGVCSSCAQPLRWEAFAAPTTAWLAVCDQHGFWFERKSLPGISDPAWRVTILRAVLSQSRTVRPEHRDALVRAVDALGRMSTPGIMQRSILHPVGVPQLLTIGVGSIADDGVVVIGPDARAHDIEKPASRWTMTVLVAVVLAVTTVLIFPLMWLTSGISTALISSGAMVVMTFLGTGMFAAMALSAPRSRIVFDVPKQTIEVLRNNKLQHSIPFVLATSTRVQLHTSVGYGDNFNVLVPLGIAELWILQGSVRNEARAVAQNLAQVLRVPFDPEEEHKH